ncbi:MAG TPA: hypothetical protein DF409_09035, partial [Bacteroidales bacterium]|nr:hypothetical protein [Bacteroidales bacterium]
MASPLQIVSTIDALCSIISKEVFDGFWKPGERLKENELTARFNVSRHSLREAFAMLVEQGILQKTANKGVRVPVFTEQDILDIFNARRVIEEAGIRKIISSGKVPHRLRELIHSISLSGQDTPRIKILAQDMDFHWEIVKTLDNTRLYAIYNNIINEIKLLNAQPKIFFRLDYVIH